MFCSKCGAAVAEGAMFCNQCGQAVGQTVSASLSELSASAGPAPDAATSGKALASMITGIFGLVFFLPAIAAIILGHISRSEIRRSNGRLKGLGMSTAGLVMGYGVVAFIPFILIIAAIAIPNLLRARMAANEASSVGLVRTVNNAEISYRAADLASLGGNSCAPPSSASACLIDNVLASGEKSGYRFSLENCVNTDTEHNYQVVAYPVTRHTTGIRTFCSDESGVIKSGEGESAEQCLANGTALDGSSRREVREQ